MIAVAAGFEVNLVPKDACKFLCIVICVMHDEKFATDVYVHVSDHKHGVPNCLRRVNAITTVVVFIQPLSCSERYFIWLF